jgi:hypothetical protein
VYLFFSCICFFLNSANRVNAKSKLFILARGFCLFS